MQSKKILYDHRQPAKEEVFVGRKSIVDRLAEGLRTGYSYGLIGEAGMGKTSTLFAVERKLTGSYFTDGHPVPIPAYVELNKQHLTHVGILFEAILSQFVDALIEQQRLEIPRREVLLEQARRGELEEAMNVLSGLYYNQKMRPCRFILLLDDLHRGLNHSVLNEVISALRPIVSPRDTVANLSLVLAGELPLEQEFRSDVSSLRGLLSDTVKLVPLLLNDVATLVELAEFYDWSVERDCAETTFNLTRGHPFKLHYYFFKALEQYGEISQSVLEVISKDPHIQRYLETVLKQRSVLDEHLRSTSSSRVPEMDRAADVERARATAKSTIQGKQETSDFDVFLCYNTINRDAIMSIGEQLKEQGLLPWLDEWELRPGIPWQNQLEKQIRQVKSAAVFVGRDGIGPWQEAEIRAFLSQFVNRGCPVIPVLLENAPEQPELPLFLSEMAWVDFRESESCPFQRLIWGITGKKPFLQ